MTQPRPGPVLSLLLVFSRLASPTLSGVRVLLSTSLARVVS